MCFAPLGKFDVNPLYEILDILKIDQIYSLEAGKYMYKLKRDLLPIPIANHFSVDQPPKYEYTLRSRNTPAQLLIKFRTSFGEKGIQKKTMKFGVHFQNT